VWQRYLRVRSAIAFPESVVRFGRVGVRWIVAALIVCLTIAFLRLLINDVESNLVVPSPAPPVEL
jgi:hypothetical protein